MRKLRSAIRHWQRRRRFVRVLKSWGILHPTRRQIDLYRDVW